MSTALRVCLLGLGEVGSVFAEDLRGRVEAIAVWDPLFSSPASGPSGSAQKPGLAVAATAAQAVADADLIVSAVTAAQCVAAASSVVGHLKHDAWYLDLNSVSPGARREAADIVTRAGGRYVESAVMAPIAPQRLSSPMLLGGPHAAAFRALASQLRLDGARFFSERLGDSSAAKMCRSVVVKGLEALVLESLLTARAHGVEGTVLESLQGPLPADNWRDFARYMITRSQTHGRRRAEEMREVARTVREAGHASPMSEGCASWQDWAAGKGTMSSSVDLESILDSLNHGRVSEFES